MAIREMLQAVQFEIVTTWHGKPMLILEMVEYVVETEKRTKKQNKQIFNSCYVVNCIPRIKQSTSPLKEGIFWVMTLSSFIIGYKCSEGTCYLTFRNPAFD
jgi:hypothetical protein